MPAKMMDVTVLFLEECHASTAIAAMEIFNDTGVLWNIWTGEKETPRFRVTTASIDGKGVQGYGPLRLTPEKSIKDVKKSDLIFVPSSGLDVDGIIARNRPLLAWLKKWRDQGAYIAGVCSGVSILAAAGLLDGKPATTHWAMAEEFAERFPEVDWRPDKFVTEADGVFCGGGIYASMDLSLYLVEKFCGRDIARQTAKAMLIDMPRTCQTGFSVLPVGARHGDGAILKAEEWIHENYNNDFRVDDVASEMGMSPRNFVRRFKRATGETPLNYLQKLRVVAAKRMFEDGHTTVQEVSFAVGYDDAAFFRQVFKRHAGLPPNEYRQRFGNLPHS